MGLNLYLRIDINLVSMVLLGIVFMIANHNLNKTDKMNRIFLKTSIIIILQLLIETLTCLFNRRPETWLIPVNVFLHVCLFIVGPLLTYLWSIFVYSWLLPEKKFWSIETIALLIPLVINLIATVLSPFTGWTFSISNLNVYQRGPLFPLSAAITYFYLFYSLMVVIKNRKKIVKEEMIPLLIFGVFSAIGGIVQTLFYGTLLMWSSVAFSFIIVYIFLQQRTIQLDKLTGAWTRRSFEYYISQRANNVNNWGGFSVIFIDLDGLKHINDQYGHLEGDQAIQSAVKLIRDSIRKTDIIARFGGDEFVIVLDCVSKDEIEKVIRKIDASFNRYNESSGKAYKIEYSYGTDIYSTNFRNIEHFLNHVDNLMYQSKEKKKNDLTMKEGLIIEKSN